MIILTIYLDLSTDIFKTFHCCSWHFLVRNDPVIFRSTFATDAAPFKYSDAETETNRSSTYIRRHVFCTAFNSSEAVTSEVEIER